MIGIPKTTSALSDFLTNGFDIRACKACTEFQHQKGASAEATNCQPKLSLGLEDEPRAEVRVCKTLAYIFIGYLLKKIFSIFPGIHSAHIFLITFLWWYTVRSSRSVIDTWPWSGRGQKKGSNGFQSITDLKRHGSLTKVVIAHSGLRQ